ncbi:hypothetical protein Goarm_017573 [Gossypium armourianum]|uniref:RNase H type-1 domain-containing protein n=1 Tax=Gossypium armourianum TaxID=34283 RepID=A0A7J9JH56_9ROSI|nr:hypothetical protein [Gossypium armourianum]
MFLAKLHSFYWVKTSKEGCVVIEFQWWSNPRLCVPCSKGVGPRLGIVWHAPPCGVIKFTVDGAARGKSGPAGCGGVLRDHSGKILVIFSGLLCILESKEAELRPIILALENAQKIIVESDSKVVILWCTSTKRDHANIEIVLN